MRENPGYFEAAFVRYLDPLWVEIVEIWDIEPFEVFDNQGAEREYPFDADAADTEISRQGYERTTTWEKSDDEWGAVVQPKTRTGFPG